MADARSRRRCGLTLSGSSSFHSARQASDCAANASLSSTTSTSSQLMPARLSARLAASTGPMPKMSGSTAWSPRPAMRASGSPRAPRRRPRRRSARRAAPSLSGDALPAVTVPSLTKAGLSLASFSSEVSARMPSSRVELGAGHRDDPVVVEALVPGRAPRAGGCAARTRPAPRGRRRRCRRASRRSRRARSSTGRASRGLTMRQPSVVECSVCVAAREALLGLEQHPRRAAHRLHAADHDERRRRRSRSSRLACIAASTLEPHRRLTVAPGRRRQPGQQHGHAGDVAVVLPGAVGVAEVDVVDRAGIEVGRALEQRA